MMKVKMQRTLACILLFILIAVTAGCSSPASSPPEEEINGTGAAGEVDESDKEADTEAEATEATEVSPKAREIEQVLMGQLAPLPEFNNNEKIGVLIITLANPFWVSMKEGYEEAGAELGVDVTVMAAPTEGDTKSQLETLEAMVARDYDAIIASPIEPFNLVPGVVKANKKGIKVINLGPPISTEALEEEGGWLDGRITVNYEDQGAMAAEYIVEKLGPDGGKVAIIQGVVYVNDQPIMEDYTLAPARIGFSPRIVPEGTYFVLGDNRNNSEDSRFSRVGFLPRELIVGRAVWRYWPLNKVPTYLYQDRCQSQSVSPCP